MDYVARSYSPALGRFISADTIVPRAGNPQALNRYMYVLGNVLRLIDPSGHGACGGASNQDWWDCRWYTAHGYSWDNKTKIATYANTAIFEDEGIARDVAGEAGIKFANTSGDGESIADGIWTFSDIALVGAGIFDLAAKIGGGNFANLARLGELLGGRGTTLYRYAYSWRLGRDVPAFTEYWDGGNKHVVHFYDGAFPAGNDAFAKGNAVHELAHIIDYGTGTPDGAWLRDSLPGGSKISAYAMERGLNQPLERWAEAVTQWVYSDWRRGQGGFQPLAPGQIDWLDRVLKGWGFSK